MGAAAYNRGSVAISKHLDSESRPGAFDVIDALNSLPKFSDAGTPFGPVQLTRGNGGWWIECPQTGFGYWYRTIHDAVKRWRVVVTGYDQTQQLFSAVSMPRVH